jgi:NAD(P)-dependent dehydrogenase (short-subunit alcohol dehydrogenase family)
MNRVLITGANRGIGFELCRQLLARGDQVIAVCRHASSALKKLDVRVVEGIDVSSDEAVEHLRTQLDGKKLDWVINNAGVLSVESLDSLDFASMEQQFRINALGPLRVTAGLRANLSAGSKIGIITSRMGSIDDNTSGGYYGYRMSKVAVNMAGVSLAHDLKDREVAVALLHPGYVATDMTNSQGIPASQAAEGLIQRMNELNMTTSGGFWHAQGELLPW